jgi:membrane protein DedA with SNARE-associated domain|tara:strand:- start:110 stop:478 length:369 start_codon:yes stop_codon:yes gene_type:complete
MKKPLDKSGDWVERHPVLTWLILLSIMGVFLIPTIGRMSNAELKYMIIGAIGAMVWVQICIYLYRFFGDSIREFGGGGIVLLVFANVFSDIPLISTLLKVSGVSFIGLALFLLIGAGASDDD